MKKELVHAAIRIIRLLCLKESSRILSARSSAHNFLSPYSAFLRRKYAFFQLLTDYFKLFIYFFSILLAMRFKSCIISMLISGPVVKRLRHCPFTAVTWVRTPSGSPHTDYQIVKHRRQLRCFIFSRSFPPFSAGPNVCSFGKVVSLGRIPR